MVIQGLAVLLLGAATWLWMGPWNRSGAKGTEGSLGFANHTGSMTLRRRGQRSRETHGNPVPLRGRKEKNDTAGDTEQYAKFVRQLAAMLHAGTGPATAFGLLAELWSSDCGRPGIDIHRATMHALAQLHTGGTLQQGLAAHAAAHGQGHRLWARLAWSLAICEESGAALADLLETVADDAETSADMHRALQSALAGPRATSKLLTYLPVIGLGVGQLLGINPLMVLTAHPVGRIALLSGTCLWLANRVWCARMLRGITDKVPS